ncbi:MAG: ATP-binding cassette domain-containing protein, partial [Cyanobacteria bacterium]|nr:ATP-binding cassette domain-containing protein [Cyanobacteriota bacterium]
MSVSVSCPGPPLLALRGISVRYGAISALSGVDLEIHEGELVALLGSNGAGKSTTLRAISRLVKPQLGRIEWQGRSLTKT